MGFFDKITGAISTAQNEVARALKSLPEMPAAPARVPEKGIGERLELFATSTFETAKDYGKALGQSVADAPGNLKEAVKAQLDELDRQSPPGRPLTGDEVSMLKTQLFGDSVDFSKVRIKENEQLATKVSDGCPFTVGNTIFIPPGRMPLKADLLAHEMMHVWQFQTGGSEYLPKALWAQKLGDGYDFAKGIGEGKTWGELNPEQQGEFIEQAQLSKALASADHHFLHDGQDYTEFLKKALVEIRAGRGGGD